MAALNPDCVKGTLWQQELTRELKMFCITSQIMKKDLCISQPGSIKGTLADGKNYQELDPAENGKLFLYIAATRPGLLKKDYV